MGKYIIYKGYADQYRWRQVDPEGDSTDTLVVDGEPSFSGLFDTKESAIADVQAKDPEAVIVDREAQLEEINAKKLAEKQANRTQETENSEVNIQ